MVATTPGATGVFDVLAAALAEREAQALTRRRRTLDGPQQPRALVDGRLVLAFCSNDYLGLAYDPSLIAAAHRALDVWGTGAGASHLLSGHQAAHQQLEERLADWVGMPRALLFSTGYMANLGVITALVGKDDAVFADRLNHASLNDGMQLSRATIKRYPHNDTARLQALLAATPARRRLIVTDAVFSMDGDLAPLAELLALAEQYDAWLLVDDAHGFGVLGEGRGSLSALGLRSDRLILMATLGKAVGVSGAFVAGHATLIEWLVQHARTHTYTTAAPASQAATVWHSLEMMREGAARRSHLFGLMAQLRAGLAGLSRWRLMPSPTPIQPLWVGSNQEAVALSEALWQAGVWVPAIRPPTVPAGSARLRISLSAAHQADEVARLIELVQHLERDWPNGAKA